MIKLLILNILFIYINGEIKSENICLGRNVTSKNVIDYCMSINGLLENRCCLKINSNDILAIDLTEMNFEKIPNINQYENLINVNMIDLRLNSHLKYSEENDFLGLKSLDYLLLPEQIQCPGDKYVWKIINQTNDPLGIFCMYQKDFCMNYTNKCIQSTSYCVTNGPNHFLCLCKNDFYGYKCLRYGQFPIKIFFGTVTILTGMLTIFFYLIQQRKS